MGYAREFRKHLYAYDLCLRALLLGGLVPLMVALAACGGGGGGDGNGGSNTKPPKHDRHPAIGFDGHAQAASTGPAK